MEILSENADDAREKLARADHTLNRLSRCFAEGRLSTSRIAVLGIKTEKQAQQPAFYVPKYMQAVGYRIIPVPVYYPTVVEILGQRVYRKLREIPEDVDLINVFRRSEDISQHIDDMIAKEPKTVWFQSGIRNEEAAERLAKAGIAVVQDRCIMVEHMRAKR